MKSKKQIASSSYMKLTSKITQKIYIQYTFILSRTTVFLKSKLGRLVQKELGVFPKARQYQIFIINIVS